MNTNLLKNRSPLNFVLLLIYPSIGLLMYLFQRMAGTAMPAPHFSLPILLGYSTVFFMPMAKNWA